MFKNCCIRHVKLRETTQNVFWGPKNIVLSFYGSGCAWYGDSRLNSSHLQCKFTNLLWNTFENGKQIFVRIADPTLLTTYDFKSNTQY